MSDLPAQVATGIALALIFSGAWILWRLVLSPAARAEATPVRLAPWPLSIGDFLLFLWCVIVCGLIFQIGSGHFLKSFNLSATQRLIFAGAAFQLGMLTGILFFRLVLQRRAPATPPLVTLHPALSGIAAFLVSLPVLTVVSIAWQFLLGLFGIEAEKQDLIDIFATTKSPALLAFMILLATVIAPITEELLFRWGMFRYARTRIPRWLALLLPACLFGALHANLASFAPLVALGVIFSLAYERTGRIGTTIIAHGLFNLNTIVLILCGVTS